MPKITDKIALSNRNSNYSYESDSLYLLEFAKACGRFLPSYEPLQMVKTCTKNPYEKLEKNMQSSFPRQNQRSNCQHPLDHQKSTRVPEKTSALLTMPKPLTVWITTNGGKFLKRWEYQTTWPASWEICMQVKKQQLELNMEQETGSKSGKEYVKAVSYLTSRQSTSWEMPGWMKHKLESRLPGEISITSDMQVTPPLWQEVKKN